jgi:hypothetical protein
VKATIDPLHTMERVGATVEDILGACSPASKLIPGIHWGRQHRHPQPRLNLRCKFLVSSPGRAWIQDGPNGRMIELPLLTPSDGTVLVDTDPTARTLTAATDPVDPLFYRIARNSQLLDFFLHDLTVLAAAQTISDVLGGFVPPPGF